MTRSVQRIDVAGDAGRIAVYQQGDTDGIPVLMAHSILSSSMMWEAQSALLAGLGYRVLRLDTRGHGASQAGGAQASMDDLVRDSVAVLDALDIPRVHYVGLSLGGMSGFGLGIAHAARLSSLCLCDARADAPAAFAAPWDERIATAQSKGCGALAASTTERWFGRAFLDSQPETARAFEAAASATSVEGFVACARALQKLDYLHEVHRISSPTTLICGSLDGPLPDAMHDIRTRIADSTLELIAGGRHLPNIDQTDAFNAALLRHLDRVVGATP